MDFPGGTVVKILPADARDTKDTGSIPDLGRSPGEGNVSPLQYSCLENSMDRGAWWATVHGVAELAMTEWLNTSFFKKNFFLTFNWYIRTSLTHLGILPAPKRTQSPTLSLLEWTSFPAHSVLIHIKGYHFYLKNIYIHRDCPEHWFKFSHTRDTIHSTGRQSLWSKN